MAGVGRGTAPDGRRSNSGLTSGGNRRWRCRFSSAWRCCVASDIPVDPSSVCRSWAVPSCGKSRAGNYPRETQVRCGREGALPQVRTHPEGVLVSPTHGWLGRPWRGSLQPQPATPGPIGQSLWLCSPRVPSRSLARRPGLPGGRTPAPVQRGARPAPIWRPGWRSLSPSGRSSARSRVPSAPGAWCPGATPRPGSSCSRRTRLGWSRLWRASHPTQPCSSTSRNGK